MNSYQKAVFAVIFAAAVPAAWGAVGFGAGGDLDVKAALAEARASQAPEAPQMASVSRTAGVQSYEPAICAEAAELKNKKFRLSFRPESGSAPLELEFSYESCGSASYDPDLSFPDYPVSVYREKGANGYALAVGAQKRNGVAQVWLRQDHDGGFLISGDFRAIPLSQLGASGRIDLGAVTITDWHVRGDGRNGKEFKGQAVLTFGPAQGGAPSASATRIPGRRIDGPAILTRLATHEYKDESYQTVYRDHRLVAVFGRFDETADRGDYVTFDFPLELNPVTREASYKGEVVAVLKEDDSSDLQLLNGYRFDYEIVFTGPEQYRVSVALVK